MKSLNKKGKAHSGPSRFKRKDGTLIWGIVTVRRICGPDGKTLYYQGFLEDITEHKAAEDALQKAQEQYREIFEICARGHLPNRAWRTIARGQSGRREDLRL